MIDLGDPQAEEAFLIMGKEVSGSSPPDLRPAAARARIRHEALSNELHLLRARLQLIREQLRVVAESGQDWANKSARAQLGPYPWLKFAGIAAGTFVVGRALRRLPLGAIATVALPLVTRRIQAKR